MGLDQLSRTSRSRPSVLHSRDGPRLAVNCGHGWLSISLRATPSDRDRRLPQIEVGKHERRACWKDHTAIASRGLKGCYRPLYSVLPLLLLTAHARRELVGIATYAFVIMFLVGATDERDRMALPQVWGERRFGKT